MIIQPVRAPEPVVASAPEPRTIRIVDPSVAGEEDDIADDLYLGQRREASIEQPRSYPKVSATEHRRPAPSNPLPDPRIPPEPKRGWMSLFGGRPRYDAPSAYPAPSRAGGAAAAQAPEQDAFEGQEDLEIPSFLRRLAN